MTTMQRLLSLLPLAGVLGAVLAQAPAVPPQIELRPLAHASYDRNGVRFDLDAETKRLQAWLETGGNREAVRKNPFAIAGFNALEREPADGKPGGPASTYLRWVPRQIAPATQDRKQWQPALSREPDTRVVACFDDREWQAGPGEAHPMLIELVPVNFAEPAFTTQDFDPARLSLGEEAGQPVLVYAMRAPRAADFAEWTRRHGQHRIATIANGSVRAAPILPASVDGTGRLAGLGKREIEELISAAKGAPAPMTVTDLTTPKDQLPKGTDPADIRAMQGAQAMLEAEKRLRALIKEGKITGIDQILTFEEISSWPYEDGLKGMPKYLEKLDGKTVMMTGFMLPIDEVENIKEFLLVQSLWSCCYGQPPDINGIVRVVMTKGRIDYKFEPLKIIGKFKVKASYEDGYCVDIYQLHAESVEVIK